MEIEDLNCIIDRFHNLYCYNSILKYSSNVVENCIQKSEVELFRFIDELILNHQSACNIF